MISVDVEPFLVTLFNRSFEEGYVSSCFKKAIVTSLIKKERLDADDLCSPKLCMILSWQQTLKT